MKRSNDGPVRLEADDGHSLVYASAAPAGPTLILAHGAGAGQRSPFMVEFARGIAALGVTVVTFDFPYISAKRRVPDRGPVLESCYRSVIAAVLARRESSARAPLFAGGKSMGGRMTSQALAQQDDERVRGIVFVGFPLHGAGKPPDKQRAEHLARVRAPLLFVQGTRDALARLDLITEVVHGLAPRATLHVVDDADHGFHVQKSSGRDDAAVIEEIAEGTRLWVNGCMGE